MIARGLRIVPGPAARMGLSILLAAALGAPAAFAMPLVGFVENWPGTALDGWGGGAELVNPGTGGVGGAADGFLLVSTPFAAHLGTMSMGPEYTGDWLAAGVNKVRVWLNDVNGAEPLEIHFAIGNSLNFWQYNVGFHPAHGVWQQFEVDLGSSANFTRIIGQGTFAAALQRVDRILLRHDLAPFVQSPDYIQGDFGIDGLLLTNDAVPVTASSWGRLKTLYR